MATQLINDYLPLTSQYIDFVLDADSSERVGHHNYVVEQVCLNTSPCLDDKSKDELKEFDLGMAKYLAHLDSHLELESFTLIDRVKYYDYADDNNTIEVKAICLTLPSSENEEVPHETDTFIVQTADGEYRSDLGCLIFSEETREEVSWEDIDFNESIVIKAANSFLNKEIEVIHTKFIIDGSEIAILVQNGDYNVVEFDRSFINKDTNSYQRQFSEPLETFSSKKEAIDWLCEQ